MMEPVQKAKWLRQQQTQAEEILWQRLRNRQLAGYKFRRQYPIEQYIVDFICYSEKLIIELDGVHHHSSEQREYDQVRTEFLQADGYRIMRFDNTEVTNNLVQRPSSLQDNFHRYLSDKSGICYPGDLEGAVLEQVLTTIRLALQSPSPPGRGVGVRGSAALNNHQEDQD